MTTPALFNVSLSARSLPEPLLCPVCGNGLTVDPCWVSPHWLCSSGHTYSNLRVLVAELYERGWLSPDATREGQSDPAPAADPVVHRRVEWAFPSG
jgi:hypothetical protein